MNTSNIYQKHLDLDKRIKIEKGIEGESFYLHFYGDKLIS